VKESVKHSGAPMETALRLMRRCEAGDTSFRRIQRPQYTNRHCHAHHLHEQLPTSGYHPHHISHRTLGPWLPHQLGLAWSCPQALRSSAFSGLNATTMMPPSVPWLSSFSSGRLWAQSIARPCEHFQLSASMVVATVSCAIICLVQLPTLA